MNGDTEPTRPKVWAIEAALGAEPGGLSHLLGYRPVRARSVTTVPAAIDPDPRLDRGIRKVLVAVDRAVTED